MVTRGMICPNCLRNGNIASKCPECGTITVDMKAHARVPRKNANKKEWIKFIESQTFDPQIFALKLGHSITNEEIERRVRPEGDFDFLGIRRQGFSWNRLDYLKEGIGNLKDWSLRMEKAILREIKQFIKAKGPNVKLENCLFVQADGKIQVLVQIETKFEEEGFDYIYKEIALQLQKLFKRNNPPLEFICEEGERKGMIKHQIERVLERSW